MIIKTFDEITDHMENHFDAFIAEKTDGVKIKRTNNNVLHNIFKADGKGYELIQAACVALDSKFDVARCSDSDLVSMAKLVGTTMLQGKQTALRIKVKNTSTQSQGLLASSDAYPATLRFMYSADVWFEFIVPSVTIFDPGQEREYFAWSVDPNSTETDGSQSPLVGAYPVTEMRSISVSATSEAVVSEGFSFSCLSTDGTLGYFPETVYEFRKRILTDTDRQNIFNELEIALNNLPTILAAKVTFNPSISNPKTVGPVTIPPYQMLLSVNGEVRSDFGETVLAKTYIPTAVAAAPYGDYLIVPSDSFADGFVRVNFMHFRAYEYMIELAYTSDPTLALDDTIQSKIVTAMRTMFGNPSKYTKELTEDIFYDTAKNLDIDSLKVLNVDLLEYDNGWVKPTEGFIPVPASDIARMCGVKFLYGEAQEKEVLFYQADTPVFGLEGTLLTISSAVPGAIIHYTTDGTAPTSSSAVYTDALTVSSGEVVKALVTSPYRNPSDIAEYEVRL